MCGCAGRGLNVVPCFGCSRRTLSVLVLSTCQLYPRDETVLPPLRIPGWR